jgi:hypothetical protein
VDRLKSDNFTLSQIGLPDEATDQDIWRRCQERQLCLITANRNKFGLGSLEATIQNENQPDSLPVFTIGDADLVAHDHTYSERIVERLLEFLIDIDNYRGAGRLYLP